MKERTSKQSSEAPAYDCFNLDPLSNGNPTTTRIASAWEVICIALEELDLPKQVMVALELERRAREIGQERLRKAQQQMNRRRNSTI